MNTTFNRISAIGERLRVGYFVPLRVPRRVLWGTESKCERPSLPGRIVRSSRDHRCHLWGLCDGLSLVVFSFVWFAVKVDYRCRMDAFDVHQFLLPFAGLGSDVVQVKQNYDHRPDAAG